MSAIGKLTSQMGQLQDNTRDVLEKHVTGVDVELRQVSELVTDREGIIQRVLNID